MTDQNHPEITDNDKIAKLGGIEVMARKIGVSLVFVTIFRGQISIGSTYFFPISSGRDLAEWKESKVNSRGYTTRFTELLDCSIGGPQRFIELSPAKKAGGSSHAFTGLIAVIWSELVSNTELSQADRIVYNSILKFKKDTSNRPRDGMTIQQITGLFGELKFLQFLQGKYNNWQKSLTCWEGWNSAKQDFRGKNWTIEVKASLAQNPDYIWINGISQLAIPSSGYFMLCLIQFNDSSTRIDCISKLVEEIRVSMSVNERITFVERLKEANYKPTSGVDHDDVRFGECEFHFYNAANEKFPRVTVESEIYKMIVDLKYKIRLLDLQPFMMKREVAQKCIFEV